jgi:hypothetical protein
MFKEKTTVDLAEEDVPQIGPNHQDRVKAEGSQNHQDQTHNPLINKMEANHQGARKNHLPGRNLEHLVQAPNYHQLKDHHLIHHG